MWSQKFLLTLIGVAVVGALAISAQDYDEDNYGPQGGNNNNQADADSYGNGYNDDGYSNNQPNYQQNVDSDGSNSNPNYSSQGNGGGGGDTDGDYEGDDGSAAAAASSVSPSVVRVRRSTEETNKADQLAISASQPKLRVKRHGKYYIGPVYTYVKTDKHANFKWGVKHKVGKKHHG